MALDLQPIESSELDLQPLDLQPVEAAPAANRFAKPDGTPWTAQDFIEAPGFLERMGRRFTENAEALANVPEAARDLVLGSQGKSRGQAALELLGGTLSPLNLPLIPIEAAAENAIAGVTGSEKAAEIGGTLTGAISPIVLAKLAQLGKVGQLGESLAALTGATPGALKETPGVQNFIKGAGQDVAQEAYAMRELPAAVRETVLDPSAMQRSSSLLDAAQQTVVPSPGNITAGAAMETGRGEVGRLLPTQSDAFRTTQESIERATGGMGQASAQALRGERDDLSRQILQQAEIEKNAREMAQVEAMVGGRQAPVASRLTGSETGIDQKLVEQYLLTGDEKPLLQAVRNSATAKKLGASLLGKDSALIAEAGTKAKGLSNIGGVLRGLFQESTREVARFGPAGKVLAKEMVQALDKGEREAGAAVTMVQKLVRGLTANEKESLVDFLDQGVTPINANVQDVGLQLRAMLGDVAQRATNAQMTLKNILTGEVVPWAPKPSGDYFPHFSNIDFDELYGNPKRVAEAVREIAADNGVPLDVARRQLDFMMRNAERRFGNLEMSRVMNWKRWDRDPERALSRYFAGAYKRLNLAEQFRQVDPVSGKPIEYGRADQLVALIGSQSDDSAGAMAKTYADRILGREEIGSFERNFGPVRRALTNFQVVTKLGQAVLANASQPVLTAVTAGIKPTIKGINEILFRNGSEFAGMTGSMLDATMGQIQRELGSSSLGSSVLRGTGFSAVERFNRMLSANAGKVYAEDTFKRLMGALDSGSSRAGFYKEQLAKLGINPADAIGRGSLNLDDLYKAGQALTKRTQFKTGVQDLPIHATSELGKMLFQFKTFSFKAAQMFKDEIVLEAKKGNYAPLTRAALLMPLAGELVNDVQAVVNGKSRPDKLVERLADNFAAVGAFGLLYTALKATQFGPAGVVGVALGPTVGDIVRTTANLGSASKNLFNDRPLSTDPLEKQLVSTIPVVGPMIANRVYPSKEEKRRRSAR